MSKEQAPAAAADPKPPEPNASDVARIAGQLVTILQPLPPALQLRALGATATMLGIDKGDRARANGSPPRTSNQQQTRSGGGNR